MVDKKTILLSKYLGVKRKQLEEKGVFDSTLGIDTKLFIDPKLLVESNLNEFSESRKTILKYFDKLLRAHQLSEHSGRLRKEVVSMLAVKEPIGLSIGYGNKTDGGTAIPESVAREILLSATEILRVGVEDPEIMELLGLFVNDFGPDRMSDLIAHIIYIDLCKFTANVSEKLKIKNLKLFTIQDQEFYLPVHPFLNKQIIFIPSSFLRQLPVATNWDEIQAAASFNNELRKSFHSIISSVLKDATEKMTKQTAQVLIKSKEQLEKLLYIYKQTRVDPYSLEMDPAGYYHIYPFVEQQEFCIQPLYKPKNHEELIDSVKELIEQYKRSIVDNGGNKLLYRTTNTGALKPWEPHREEVAQTLFYLIADTFCQKADIMLSGESDAGKGKVDFALGTGYKTKVLVELKKNIHSDLVNGFEKQITTYERSENAYHSFYVIIIVKSEDPTNKVVSKLKKVEKIYHERLERGLKSPELIIIDGLVYPSPSKLK